MNTRFHADIDSGNENAESCDDSRVPTPGVPDFLGGAVAEDDNNDNVGELTPPGRACAQTLRCDAGSCGSRAYQTAARTKRRTSASWVRSATAARDSMRLIYSLCL
jgi:hypothetical protein